MIMSLVMSMSVAVMGSVCMQMVVAVSIAMRMVMSMNMGMAVARAAGMDALMLVAMSLAMGVVTPMSMGMRMASAIAADMCMFVSMNRVMGILTLMSMGVGMTSAIGMNMLMLMVVMVSPVIGMVMGKVMAMLMGVAVMRAVFMSMVMVVMVTGVGLHIKQRRLGPVAASTLRAHRAASSGIPSCKCEPLLQFALWRLQRGDSKGDVENGQQMLMRGPGMACRGAHMYVAPLSRGGEVAR
jgi:hypothetical protein